MKTLGGPFASISGCGSVITNWLSKSGSHTQYKAKVDASEDIVVARATFEAPLDCSGTFGVPRAATVSACHAPSNALPSVTLPLVCVRAAVILKHSRLVGFGSAPCHLRS
jgi:uncharacterized protein YceK